MRSSILLVSVVVWFWSNLMASQTTTENLHANWDSLLKIYVDDDGNVDYKNLKSCSPKIISYLETLANNAPTSDWSKNEKLAFYINLYNAATVKLILDNYPLKSIKNISRPWDKEWITIGNKVLSLGDIEHKILRKMQEPRIHFAINCASYSCPQLKNEAFVSSKVDSQLDEATRNFINDPKRNKITPKEVELSEIFKWFKKDFTNKGTLIDFIKPYTLIKITKQTHINYITYNWSLNEK
ncbi:DUF547 domain-containing protein [Maribacter sp.]|uniref:DUF547 domain-containing protein n=1 Tax=Maribacter sp. TaxID=1897614 RepID=UPI0025C3AB02|nr:DUF547 domain-containing protein [Maribacter sp.]